LQAITISDKAFKGYRRQVDFIQRYIFPGGMLPSRRRLTELAMDVGLSWLSDFSHGGDYARTLACWTGRFDMAWPQIRALGFDERFRRAWRYYLGYCEAGFLTGRTDLIHVVLTQSTNGAKGPIR
jgi:cyclopropane-fatty-acyl-phospholipid synthase